MVTLRETVEKVQTDLRQTKGPVDLTRPLGLLSGVLSSLPEGGMAPILQAKEACEALVDCAREAEDADDSAFAECLRNHVHTLSPVVALCMG